MRALRGWLVPRSLRRQFTLAVGGLSLLMVAGGMTAVYALRATTGTARQLSEDRLQRMQQAQELVQRTLLVEREWYRLAGAESEPALRDSQAGIVSHLEEFDRLADGLARGEDDIEILGLHHASQVFRNLVAVAAQLRESRLQAERGSRGAWRPSQPEPGGEEESARQIDGELRRHAAAMVAATQLQSDRYARDYRQAVERLVETSSRWQRWVMVLLAGSLLAAWLIALEFLGGHVLARLQQVSRGLRQRDAAGDPDSAAKEGGDEIDEMARAVDAFQEDRRKLVQRTAELEAAYKELEELSYAISHEMRSPLRALDGFSKLLLDRAHGGLDDEGRRMLRILRDNAQRQGRLVDDILRFLALGRQKMAYGSVDVGSLAWELFEQIQAAEPGRRLRLELGVLPPAWGDRAMIRQALHNLLANAVKFSPPDAEALIEVRGAAGEREDSYCVSDRGVGFDMRYVNKLFRAFERVHPTGLYAGTGMGLAIVKRIVDRHGGRVWAEGREGEGASFHFALPAPPGAAPRGPQDPLHLSR